MFSRSARLRALGLKIPEGIAHLGRALVILTFYRFMERALQLLATCQGTLGADFLKPILQGLHLAARVGCFTARAPLEEGANFLEAFLDEPDGEVVIVLMHGLRRAGAREDHEKLRTKLLKRPRQFFVRGVFGHKVEDGEIAFGITHHAGVVFQLEQTNVPVMVLQGLKLEFGTIFRFQLKALVAAFVSGDVAVKARPVMIEQRGATEGTSSVRTPFGIHLQQTQIHSKLDFLPAVLCLKPANDHLSRLVFPFLQEVRYIEIHIQIMTVYTFQVNETALPGARHASSSIQEKQPEMAKSLISSTPADRQNEKSGDIRQGESGRGCPRVNVVTGR
jgi:hypothetical protein